MAALKKINQPARKIMDILTLDLRHPGDHKKIDNTEKTFIPVTVECIDLCASGTIFSVCHYGEQNGDLMRDPEITFLRDERGDYYPLSFQNDYLGIHRESVLFSDGKPSRFYPSIQRDQAVFVGAWMRNIKQQQGL